MSDSMTKGMQALAAMEQNAARISQVGARLLEELAGGLPELLAVMPEARPDGARLLLLARSVEDARRWARALGEDVTVEVGVESEDQIVERSAVEFTVDGVSMRVSSVQFYTADQWAYRIAEAVTA